MDRNSIVRTFRLAARLATLTGNRDAAVGKTAEEIAQAIGELRRRIIQDCLVVQRGLRNEGMTVRLPILKDLLDGELLKTRADLTRKGFEARQAKAKAELDAKRGIRPVRHSSPAPVYDPFVERLREIKARPKPAEAAE